MLLIYGGTPTYTENTGLGSLSISTSDVFQTTEIRGDELLNLYPDLFTAVTNNATILEDGTVTNAKLDDLAQGSIKVGTTADAVTDLDASTDGYILIGDGTDLNSVAISGDVTMANDGTTTIGADKVTSSMIDEGVKKVETITLTSALILNLNTIPRNIITAPGEGKYIVVDRITASIDYNTTAYATNTTLEFSYGTATTKVTADIASLLDVTADTVQSVGGIETELSLALNDNIQVTVATGNPDTGDSDIKITVEYRILSI